MTARTGSKKRFLPLALGLILFLGVISAAAGAAAGGGLDYRLVSREIISEGTWLMEYRVVIAGKETPVQVLEVDLTNPYVQVGAMSGADGQLTRPQNVISMVKDYGAVAGINGDFFNLGSSPAPFGIHLEGGELRSSPLRASHWQGFGVDRDNVAHIANFSYKGQLLTSNGQFFEIYGYNQPQHYIGTARSHVDRVMLYDRYWGDKVPASFFDLSVFKVVVQNGVVTRWVEGNREVQIPEDGYVLVGEGKGEEFLRAFARDGARLEVFSQVEPSLNLEMAVGGNTLLVKGGRVAEAIIAGNKEERHPRSGVGISQEQEKVWLVAVEGAPHGPGMKLGELAGFMVQLGVYQGMNLDGGGSTTLAARKLGELEPVGVTRARYGTYRPVPNGVGIFNLAPRGPVQELIIYGEDKLLPGSRVPYRVTGYDRHYHPVELDQGATRYSVPAHQGIFTDNLLTVTGSGEMTIGAVNQGGRGEKTIYVYKAEDILQVQVRPPSLRLMPGQEARLEASVTLKDGSVIPAREGNVTWESSQPGVAKVDQGGRVTVLSVGKAEITVTITGTGIKSACQVKGAYPALPRLSGEDRYLTAVEISKAGWESAGTVVLARGDHYADALAGVPLAYHLEAPVLLTLPGRLPPATRQEIQRLGATRIIILGGAGAVGPGVQGELEQAGLEVVRLAGDNRYETAALIARQLMFLAPAGTGTAVLAYGDNFPDALAAAPYAAVLGHPILLTPGDRLHPASAQVIRELGIYQCIVAGGPGVIGDAVLQGLPRPTRVSGIDRYATAVALARHFAFPVSHKYIATGSNFADAITGAVLAARKGTGILLAGPSIAPEVEGFLRAQGIEELTILGGKAAVGELLEGQLSHILGH